jgi:hypothetical protein
MFSCAGLLLAQHGGTAAARLALMAGLDFMARREQPTPEPQAGCIRDSNYMSGGHLLRVWSPPCHLCGTTAPVRIVFQAIKIWGKPAALICQVQLPVQSTLEQAIFLPSVGSIVTWHPPLALHTHEKLGGFPVAGWRLPSQLLAVRQIVLLNELVAFFCTLGTSVLSWIYVLQAS